MRQLVIMLIGVFFGIALTKGEIISWYRIHEMFRFESFHMYGVIGSAVVLGIIFQKLSRKFNWTSVDGTPFLFVEYPKGWKNYLYGGTIFGLGWAMTGGCPGPLYILFGYGYTVIIVAIFGAIMGTFVYGLIRHKLPHY
ncbi:MAG: YeeE/YedE family protein [Flavobacteriales bacterium]|nr:YeeE/YedE family protein [Flavobacteriales bacterium]